MRESTRSEISVPPWKRMIETPTVKISCAPSPLSGLSAMPSADGPISAPIATSTIICGTRRSSRDRPGAEAGTEDQPEAAQDLLNVHRQRATLLSALPVPEGRGRAAMPPGR